MPSAAPGSSPLGRRCIARCTRRPHRFTMGQPVATRGVDGLTAVVLENRSDCRSRQAAPHLPGFGVTNPGCLGRENASRESVQARCWKPARRRLSPGYGGGSPAQRKQAKGASVDGRRLGLEATCSLTRARRDWHSPIRARSEGDRGVRGRASSVASGRQHPRSEASLPV
jgi:hypothetical protein